MKHITTQLVFAIVLASCQPKEHFDNVSIEADVRTMLQAYDDSVTTILKQNAPSLSYVNNEWDTLRIQTLSKNYASFSGLVNSTMVTTGNDTFRTKLAETGLAVKRKTSWKLMNGQTNIVR